jgi:putative transposase DNA-binding domain family
VKYYDTVTRHRFTTEKGVDAEQVERDLAQMVTWMADAEREVLSNTEFHDLAVKTLKGDRPTGSLNSWGRKKLSRYNFSFQKHNMNEMLVSNVVSTLELYAMSVGLFQVMSTHTKETRPEKIICHYRCAYPDAPQPTSGMVRAHLRRYHLKGEHKASLPGVSAKLNLAVCDTHFAPKASRDDNDPLNIIVQVKTPNHKLTKICLRLPDDNERFGKGKICRPTIRLNNKGQMVFDIATEHDIDEKQTNKVVGVDLGKVEPFVATLIDPESNHRSAPYHVRYKGRLGSLVKKEQQRRNLASHLHKKADLCSIHNRTDHANVLRTEANRVSAKATRIKHEISQCVASQIVSVANQNDAHISLENLSWLDAQGGRWPHAEIQQRIENTAKRYGLKVVRVSAKDTSKTCSRCGGKTSNNSKTRIGSCNTCGFELNRDVSASREIALRATSPSSRSRNRMRSLLRQRALERSSAATRQSKPVNALGGNQRHTGTSERKTEATLMMVRETLDSRGSPT